MSRVLYVYGGIVLVVVRRCTKRLLRYAGELMKRLGRRLVALGEDSTPRWSIELFHHISTTAADAEFHIGTEVFRGPAYSAFILDDTLSFRLNWFAKRIEPFGRWEYTHGTGVLNLKVRGSSAPYEIETGDIWFTFDGGYAILYLGCPRQRLEFKGPEYTLRAFTYY